MTLDKELSLLGEVDAPTRQAWVAEAAAVLRKAGRLGTDESHAAVLAGLERRTLDDVVIPVLGTAEDVDDLPEVGQPRAAPYTRGNGPRADGWDIRTQVAEPDREAAAASILTDLGHGGTSVWLMIGGTATSAPDLDAVLADVLLEAAPVVVEADITADPLDAAKALATVIDDRPATVPASSSNLGIDPVGRLVRYGRGPGGHQGDLDGLVASAAEMAGPRGIRGLVVDATVIHDAGGTDAQELGYAMATGVTYLRALESAGLAAEEAAGLIEFRFAATDEQFPTIAKLRAARALWNRVTELAGFPEPARRQYLHVVTSRPMLTRYDPWVNLMRTTVAAFAAGSGGADAITVLPYDHAIGRPDVVARRIARNTSSLLIHESSVAHVADPAGGAYAVELLTDRVARSGWSQFQRLEAAGGVVAAFEQGLLAETVSTAWAERRVQIARRDRPITGVSEFPLEREQLPERAAWPSTPVPRGDGALPVVSYAGDFESLRDDPVDTAVFVASLGTVAQHTARASFVQNLLTAGGISYATAGATATADDVVAAYRQNPSPVVILAGANGTYQEIGRDVVEQLRDLGVQWIVLAGRHTDPLVSAVDDSVQSGDNAITFLTTVRNRLREAS